MTTYDYRALCVELTDCLEKADWPLRHRYVFRQWIDIARAALADGPAVPEGREPAAVTGQPSDGELWELYQGPGTFSPIEYARDLLARRGNPTPQPPADGEVTELTGQLIEAANGAAAMGWDKHARSILRAAELLQRLSPPQPVPVGERLPGDQLCWWFEADEDCGYGSTWTLLRIRGSTTGRTHWLPAHALPLPEVGE